MSANLIRNTLTVFLLMVARLAFGADALNGGTVGTYYASYTPIATILPNAYFGDIVFSVSGSVPPGLSVSTVASPNATLSPRVTPYVSGTPTAVGTYTFSIFSGAMFVGTYTIQVTSTPPSAILFNTSIYAWRSQTFSAATMGSQTGVDSSNLYICPQPSSYNKVGVVGSGNVVNGCYSSITVTANDVGTLGFQYYVYSTASANYSTLATLTVNGVSPGSPPTAALSSTTLVSGVATTFTANDVGIGYPSIYICPVTNSYSNVTVTGMGAQFLGCYPSISVMTTGSGTNIASFQYYIYSAGTSNYSSLGTVSISATPQTLGTPSITGITAPAGGGAVTANTAVGAVSNTNTVISWYSNSSATTPVTGNFVGGVTYYAKVSMTPNAGYAWPAITANAITVNGAAGTHAAVTAGSTASVDVIASFTASKVRPLIKDAIDASVAGVLNAQILSARQMTNQQIGNIANHLLNLHGRMKVGSDYSSITISNTELNQYAPVIQKIKDELLNGKHHTTPTKLLDTEGNKLQVGNYTDSLIEDVAKYSTWSSGVIEFGRKNMNGSQSKFTTKGVTFGVDYQVSENLISGIALGYGENYQLIDGNGSAVNSGQISLAAYGTYRPYDGLHLDGAIGYGDFKMNSSRYSVPANSMYDGVRRGDTTFGFVQLAKHLNLGATNFVGHLRAQHLSSRFGSYLEGGDWLSLGYDSINMKSSSVTIGGSISEDFNFNGNGRLTPKLKVEVSRVSQGEGRNNIYYADTPYESSTYNINSLTSSAAMIGFGLTYIKKSGETISLDWQTNWGANMYRANSLRVFIGVPF